MKSLRRNAGQKVYDIGQLMMILKTIIGMVKSEKVASTDIASAYEIA